MVSKAEAQRQEEKAATESVGQKLDSMLEMGNTYKFDGDERYPLSKAIDFPERVADAIAVISKNVRLRPLLFVAAVDKWASGHNIDMEGGTRLRGQIWGLVALKGRKVDSTNVFLLGYLASGEAVVGEDAQYIAQKALESRKLATKVEWQRKNRRGKSEELSRKEEESKVPEPTPPIAPVPKDAPSSAEGVIAKVSPTPPIAPAPTSETPPSA